MKLQNLFLCSCIFITTSLFCSETVEEHVEPETIIQNHSAPTTKGSSVFTRVWYGASAIAGKSRRTIFEEMYGAGTLKVDLENNPKEAGDRLRDVMEERFRYRQVESPENQEKTFRIFEITQELARETEKTYQLDPGLAGTYNPLQQTALEQIIHDHALSQQPKFKREKDEAIAAAEARYATNMHQLLTVATKAAAIKRTLTEQSSTKKLKAAPCEYENSEHYRNVETYTQYLQTIKDQQERK